MEPISYLMGLGNFTAAFGWYCMYITRTDMQNPIDWYRTRTAKKLQDRQGVTEERISELMEDI